MTQDLDPEGIVFIQPQFDLGESPDLRILRSREDCVLNVPDRFRFRLRSVE